MCRDPSISLTQVVLRAYCKSAGLNQRGSPRELRERLDKAMTGENVTEHIVRMSDNDDTDVRLLGQGILQGQRMCQ